MVAARHAGRQACRQAPGLRRNTADERSGFRDLVAADAALDLLERLPRKPPQVTVVALRATRGRTARDQAERDGDPADVQRHVEPGRRRRAGDVLPTLD